MKALKSLSTQMLRLKPISTTISSFSICNSSSQIQPLSTTIHNLLFLLQDPQKPISYIRSIHAQAIILALSSNEFLATKFIKTYSDLGCLNDARHIFDQIPVRDTRLWNAIIGGYLKNERYEETIGLYRRMRKQSGVEIDACTCTFALKAFTKMLDFESGREVMRDAVDNGLERNRFLGSSTIAFLVKFGSVDEARTVFDHLLYRDVVCWNSMIGGYVQMRSFGMAFDLFWEMQVRGIRPTPVTMSGLIHACIEMGSLRYGNCVHGCLNGFGMSSDVLVVTSLIDMYAKMGDVQSARKLFDRMTNRNLVSWNAMLSGYVQNELVPDAFALFRELILSGTGFDSGTMASLLQGCAQLSSLVDGKAIHGVVLRRGLESNLIVTTTLVDLYAKSGALSQAAYVFDSMKERNVISWTAMLTGLLQNGHAEEALSVFSQMQEEGVDANVVTLVSLIHACASLGSLKKGQSIHAYLRRHGFTLDEIVKTALMDMYAKCGKLESCKRVFESELTSRDVVLWNAMITSYSIHGRGHLAVGLYHRMEGMGVKPNQTTFISLLSACSHSGLVEEGLKVFHSMSREHGIRPTERHFACLVDLLGRAGRLEEAEALIQQMPLEPDSAVLEALLNGCQIHKNIDLGIKTADRLLSLDSMNPGVYVVLSNIYAEGRRWTDVDYVRDLMRKRGLRKTPGYSLTEVANTIHSFFAGDDSHPYWGEIYKMLESLRMQIEASGYVPDTSCVHRDVGEQMKVKLLWGHSERLAIAFALISTPSGSLIRITKNLRVCTDCHTVTKYISKIVRREIIVRDVNRFHHFIDGHCSCGDYW